MAADRARRTRRGALVVSVVLAVVVVVVAIGVIVARSRDGAAPSADASSPSASASATTALAPGDHTLTVQSGGLTRTLILHVPPASAGGGARPLILVYHGALDTAADTASSTDFEEVADRRGIDVAFLQGYQDTWNEGAGHTPAEVAGVDDVAFTSAALTAIERVAAIDRTRIAAVGFSNGALMTDLLGCRLADSLRLIVPVSGPLPVSVSRSCAPGRPVSVLEVHGTDDQSIPYGGGPFAGVGGGTTVLSAPAAVARWAALDRCDPTATTSTSGDVRTTSYAGCADGASVRLRTLIGAGHAWPDDIGELVADALEGQP